MKVSLGRTGVYIVVAIILLFFFIPIWVSFSAAFKTNAQIIAGAPLSFPDPIHWGAMSEALSKILPTYVNSLICIIGTLVVSCAVGSITGFYLSRYKLGGYSFLMSLVVLAVYVPLVALLVPLVNLMVAFGLYNTYLGLIITYTMWTLPISIILFKNYYDESLPSSFVDAAKVFGASRWNIYRRIGLPLSFIPLATAGILIATQVWNIFLIPLIMSAGELSTRPIAAAVVELHAVSSRFGIWNLGMAGAVLTALPILVLYALFSRYIVRGYMKGGMKEEV